ncbi:MAG: SIMPL domain-containing protein [Cyanobacteria bacterium P01_A01_bin.45]
MNRFSIKPLHNLRKTIPLALLLCINFSIPVLAESEERVLRTLTVRGTGEETIPATLSLVRLGVEVKGKDIKDVQAQAAKRSEAVVNFLKSQNVEKLKTTAINLSPVYDYKSRVRKIIAYSASNTVSFRTTTQNTGKLLDEAVKVGATRIDRVSFVATDAAIEEAQKQALREATQDAREKAEVVLTTLGLTSQEIIGIQVAGAARPPRPMARLSRSFTSAEAAPRPTTPIVAGEQEVNASVTLQIRY